MSHSIGMRVNDHNANAKFTQILLEMKTSLYCQQSIETLVGLHTNSPFFVPDQPSACTVLTRCPFNSSARVRGRFSSSRTRTGQDGVAGQIQSSERLFLRNRGELIQELLDRFTSFQVVEERLDWNPCAAEDRCASGSLWIAVHDRT